MSLYLTYISQYSVLLPFLVGVVAILFFKPKSEIIAVIFLVTFYTLVEMTSRKVAIANGGNTLLIWPFYLSFELIIGTYLLFQFSKTQKSLKIGFIAFVIILCEGIFDFSPYLTGSRAIVSIFYAGLSINWFFKTLRIKERKIEAMAMFWICSAFLIYHVPSLLYQTLEGGYINIPQEYGVIMRDARRVFNVLNKSLLTVGICLGSK